MNALDRLESILQEVMERPVALLAPRRLHALKLASALTKELESRAIPLVDRVVVPDGYELHIGPEDWRTFEGVRSRLEEELAGYLLRLTAERDLTMATPARVALVRDLHLRQGEVRTASSFREPEESLVNAQHVRSPTVALPRAAKVQMTSGEAGSPALGRQVAAVAALVLLGSAERPITRFPLDRSLVRIGRRSSNEIALADPKVSREHARIERIGGRYFLVDLGSTNGIRINGRESRGRAPLSPGDLIEIGLQRLRFEG